MSIKMSVAALAALLCLGSAAGAPYSIGLWGDLPYSQEQAYGVLAMVEDMNMGKIKFSINDGDLKSGSSVCDNATYLRARDFFLSLLQPAMFTPGDNDWVDCDRASAGAYNSLERLDYERALFFNTSYPLGILGKRILQDVQTAPLCLSATGDMVGCVENRRWTYRGVTYMTLNVQGSCNNLCDTNPNVAEYTARNAANIVWMQESFAVATALESAAVMIVSQANPGWDMTDPTRAPLRDPRTLIEWDPIAAAPSTTDGFGDYLRALRDEVVAFAKPVAYVHGDSHYFRVDKPFLDATGKRLETFTRVETFGAHPENGNNDVNWVRATINTVSREVFTFQPQSFSRVAVPY